MNETARMLDTLKRCLRARGMTYRRLGRTLNLSESSVKRLFAEESFTLVRLERVCAALGMTVSDLASMTADAGNGREARSQSSQLTLEQERVLASNASLLACYYLLLNGRSTDEAQKRLGLSARAIRTFVGKLATAQLLDVDERRQVRLHARLPIAWRADGPVRKLYERQVREEFLQSTFTAANEALSFHSAELSPASLRVLMRKIEKLGADFADLAALDMSIPSREKTSVALLLGCRPWVFSMFSAYRVQ